MADNPSSPLVLGAIAAFLRDAVAPQLQGHDAFLARVAANAAGIMQREFALGPDHAAQELAVLATLLGEPLGDVDNARGKVCAAIEAGSLSVDTPGLLAAFEGIAARRVHIEQPHYPSLALAQS